MTAEIVAKTDELSRREWLELRRTGIGGSDAAAILGVSKYQSPYSLWLDKTTTAPVPDEDDEREYQRWGKLLEEPIAAEFSARTGMVAHRLPVVIRSVERPWQLANLDFIVSASAESLNPVGILEVKTTRNADEWPVDDETGVVGVPVWVLAQDVHYMAVTGYDRVWNPVLIGGQELRIAEVHRTESQVEALCALEAEFMDLVRRGIAPSPDGSSATKRAMAARWRPVEGQVAEVDPEVSRALIAERARLKAEVAEREAIVEEIENQLREMLGESEVAQVDGETWWTWKRSESRRLTLKALRTAHPTIAAEFEKVSESRRLIVKEPK